MTETTDRIPLDELAESLNGWEEIAIRKTFGFSFDQLEEQGTIAVRALAFIELKREGVKDSVAHKQVMDWSLRELVDRYPEMNEDEPADPMASIREDEPGEA